MFPACHLSDNNTQTLLQSGRLHVKDFSDISNWKCLLQGIQIDTRLLLSLCWQNRNLTNFIKHNRRFNWRNIYLFIRQYIVLMNIV